MSIINTTYNIIIDRLRTFADGHFLINDFSHGEIAVKDLKLDGVYPKMHVTPDVIAYSAGAKDYNLRILLFDTPRSIEDKSDYQKEVISDLTQIAEDLIGVLVNGSFFGDDTELVQFPTVTPFIEEYENKHTGVELNIGLRVTYQYQACNVPASWGPTPMPTCKPVRIFVDGEFFISAPSGSTQYIDCGGIPCDDGIVENSDESFIETVPSGGPPLVLEDYIIETYLDAVLEDTQTAPAMTNITININWN